MDTEPKVPTPIKDKKQEEDKKSHQTLLTRLSVAKKFEDKQRKQWKKVLKVLDGEREVMVGGDTQVRKIKYPLLWAAYDNYLSQLTLTPPQVVIEAEKKEDSLKKTYWKGIIDYKKRKLRISDLREQFIDSLIVCGKAVYKVGRAVETKEVEKVVPTIEGQPPITQKVEAIVKNETFVEVVDPRKVWISPETKYQSPLLGEECPYIIEEMIKDPEYVEDMYQVELEDEEKELINMDDEKDDKGEVKEAGIDENTDDLKRVRVYLYNGKWEIEGECKPNCEVLFTNKRILKQREIPYAHGKKPYIYALNFKAFFKPTAKGSLDAVMDLDQEYNEHMNRIRTILRRLANPKWKKLKGTNVDEAALLDPDTGTVVDVSDVNAVTALEGPRIDPALFDKSKVVEELFQLVTGIVYGSSAIQNAGTATGQDIVSKGADTKIGRLSNIVERAEEERDIMMLQLEQQYAPTEGTDIRITGADVVEQIRMKKFLHSTAMQLYQQQAGQAETTGMQPPPPPEDEYANFEISDDGKTIFTNYSRKDIQGEFELTVISQSSNRSNKSVKSQQYLNALDRSAADPSVNRAELWKRFFYINDEDDIDSLVPSTTGQVQQPPAPTAGAGGAQPGEQVRKPSSTAINSSIKGQANKTV